MLLAFPQKYRNTSKHQHCHQFLCAVPQLAESSCPAPPTPASNEKGPRVMRYCEPRRTVELRTTTGLGGLLEISAPRYKASTSNAGNSL